MKDLIDLYLYKFGNYKPVREFKKILPGIKFLRGSGSDSLMDKAMLRLILRLPIVKQLVRSAKKHVSPSQLYRPVLSQIKNKTNHALGMQSGGSIFINRGYINREDIGPVTRRKILMHEKFHTKPIIGKSELLAHLYGGFTGPKSHKVKHVLHEYKRLWATRPIRSGLEHSTIVGAGLLGKKLLTHKKDDNA